MQPQHVFACSGGLRQTDLEWPRFGPSPAGGAEGGGRAGCARWRGRAPTGTPVKGGGACSGRARSSGGRLGGGRRAHSRQWMARPEQLGGCQQREGGKREALVGGGWRAGARDAVGSGEEDAGGEPEAEEEAEGALSDARAARRECARARGAGLAVVAVREAPEACCGHSRGSSGSIAEPAGWREGRRRAGARTGARTGGPSAGHVRFGPVGAVLFDVWARPRASPPNHLASCGSRGRQPRGKSGKAWPTSQFCIWRAAWYMERRCWRACPRPQVRFACCFSCALSSAGGPCGIATPLAGLSGEMGSMDSLGRETGGVFSESRNRDVPSFKGGLGACPGGLGRTIAARAGGFCGTGSFPGGATLVPSPRGRDVREGAFESEAEPEMLGEKRTGNRWRRGGAAALAWARGAASGL